MLLALLESKITRYVLSATQKSVRERKRDREKRERERERDSEKSQWERQEAFCQQKGTFFQTKEGKRDAPTIDMAQQRLSCVLEHAGVRQYAQLHAPLCLQLPGVMTKTSHSAVPLELGVVASELCLDVLLDDPGGGGRGGG